MALKYVCQGVNYSQKFCSKCSFPNFFNNRTAQFMFPKYGIEYQNVEVDSKNQNLKVRKVTKANIKIVVLKEHKKNRH